MKINPRRAAARSMFGCVFASTLIACAENDSAALSRIEYDEGFVRFNDASAAPRREFTLRGEMVVTVYENYVRVVLDDDDLTYIVPRERLVYIGHEIP